MENLNYKNENIERKYFKICKRTNFKDKQQPFRMRKRFHRIER